MKQKQFRTLLAGAAFGLWTIGAAWADTLNVGGVVSLTGPGAALGIPYRNVFQMLPIPRPGSRTHASSSMKTRSTFWWDPARYL